MREVNWKNWVMRTAVKWADINFIMEETAVDPINSGHKRLVENVLEMNNLIDLIDSESFDATLVDKQKSLIEKILYSSEEQFELEEGIIKKYKLPGGDKQKEEHEKILSILKSTITDFSGGSIKALHSFKTFFLGLIMNHIKDYDGETYQLENCRETIINAMAWEDFSDFVKRMENRKFDDEHKGLLEQTVKLNNFIDSQPGNKLKNTVKKKIENHFNELYNLAEQHFKDEEDFISHFDIHGFETHKDDHYDFLNKLMVYKKDILSGKEKITHDLKYEIITQWLTHINDIDCPIIGKGKCYEKVLAEAINLEDISFLVKKTGITGIDEAFDKLITLSFELNNVYGEVAEKDGIIVVNKMVEDLFNDIYTSAQKLFALENEFFKNNRIEDHEEHQGEHEGLLQIIDYYRSNFHEDRIAVSSEIKIHILKSLISHLNNNDFKAFAAIKGK